jgi:hypothetical protein
MKPPRPTGKPLKGRTFKLYPSCIELRAYIPNSSIEGIQERAAEVAIEMSKALHGPEQKMLVDYDKLEVASNRAGLHLAYAYRPPDGSNRGSSCLAENANCGYEQAINALKRAGWKECQGA